MAARAAIPALNSRGNVLTMSSGIPSARNPLHDSATLSVYLGVPRLRHGRAVVTRGTNPSSHSRAPSRFRTRTNTNSATG
jgi:hypothetical protein